MQRLALAPRRARRSAPAGARPWALRGAAALALSCATFTPGCIIVERHYYPVAWPPAAGAPAAGAAPATGAPTSVPETGPPGETSAAAAPSGEATTAVQIPQALDPRFVGASDPGPTGDYASVSPRFAFTVDGSLEVDDQESLWGFGFYVIPNESPVGFYMNSRFTVNSYGDPDFTDLFATNAFGHDLIDEELHAFVLNAGLVAPVNEVLNLFAGIGFAYTETELELRDPAGVFGDNGTYYQRIDEDDDFNFNVGALILLDHFALNAQWDTALEVASFGVGFAF